MIKLKDILLKENSPGYENRQFGDPLPTLEDITKKYQEGKKVVNEAPEHELASKLDKVSNNIFQIMKRYEKKADVEGMVRAWMLGLHSRLKKNGVKI